MQHEGYAPVIALSNIDKLRAILADSHTDITTETAIEIGEGLIGLYELLAEEFRVDQETHYVS